MKISVFVLACFAVFGACVHGYPRARELPDEDTEVLIVPLGLRSRERTVREGDEKDGEERPTTLDLDDLIPPPQQTDFFMPSYFNPMYSNPFGDFMTSLQEMMIRMRQQMSEVLHRIPAEVPPSDSGTGVTFQLGPDTDNLKNKSTSTTKVVDGHVVTVNETTYSSSGDTGGAVFQIKVIQVRPTEGAETEKPDTTNPKPEVEEGKPEIDIGKPEIEIAKPEIEIAKPETDNSNERPEQNTDSPKTETSSEEASSPPTPPSETNTNAEENEILKKTTYVDIANEWEEKPAELRELPDISENEIDQSVELVDGVERPSDLSKDTLVNDILSSQNQGLVMIDPDVELINNPMRNAYYSVEPQVERLSIQTDSR